MKEQESTCGYIEQAPSAFSDCQIIIIESHTALIKGGQASELKSVINSTNCNVESRARVILPHSAIQLGSLTKKTFRSY